MKVSMLLSALTLLGALILCLRRAGADRRDAAAGIGLLLLAALVATGMEFALEQKISFLVWMRADLCYLVMGLSCLAMLLAVRRAWEKAYPVTGNLRSGGEKE